MQHSNQVHCSIMFLGTKPSVAGDALEKTSAPTSSLLEKPFSPQKPRRKRRGYGEARWKFGVILA